MESGVARIRISKTGMDTKHISANSWDKNPSLPANSMIDAATATCRICRRRSPEHAESCRRSKAEGICHPIILGNEERIRETGKRTRPESEGIEIVNNLRHDREAERRERYAQIFHETCAREGATTDEANDKMFNVTTSV